MSTGYVDRSTTIINGIEGLELVPQAMRLLADVRSAICRHGRFFVSPEAAAQWMGDHPEGEMRPVEEAFAADRAVVTQVGWVAR